MGQSASGTATIQQDTYLSMPDCRGHQSTLYAQWIQVSGLTFQPDFLILYYYIPPYGGYYGNDAFALYCPSVNMTGTTALLYGGMISDSNHTPALRPVANNQSFVTSPSGVNSGYMNSSGFLLRIENSVGYGQLTGTATWIAYKF